MDVEKFMEKIRLAVDKELENCAKDLLSKSLDIVPRGENEVRVKSGSITHTGGTLASSGYVEARHKGLDDRVFVVAYDTRKTQGGEFNYAIIQHEKPFHHKIGQWKFLETPYKANKEEYKKRILQAIGNSVGDVSVEGGLKYTSKNGLTTREF